MSLSAAEQNRLIIENMHIVEMVASGFRGKKNIPWEDLKQEGVVGLVQAARNVDRVAGRFAAYAMASIRNSILAFVENWQEFEHLDDRLEGDQDRIFEWQIWGTLPSEGWTSLTASPEEIAEVWEGLSG